MPFNVLLLPLLGGYIFVSRWNRTRYDTRHYSGERLIFHSAIAGTFLLLLAFAVTAVVAQNWPSVARTWSAGIPFEYSGTSLLAFGFGIVGPWALNLFRDRTEEAVRAA